MSRVACKRVSFSPNQEATEEPIFPKHHDRRKVVLTGFLSFGLKTSPAGRKLIRRIRARVAKTLRSMSFRRDTTEKTSSLLMSSSSIYMKRSKSLADSESHRAEAIEDCIEFLNSSFSLSRSNSISTWSS
ncbi:hypothetical protein N665_0959s0016 [Sinapis alba]|nr:hypothetical protein N665_0959s0016 [Sinapis alba]